MKKLFLAILSVCSAMMMQAAVSKTIDITSAGSLQTKLSYSELSTVTDLTVTGTINEKDFETMYSSMTVLANIDLSAATISAYSSYSANTVPENAFCGPNYVGKESLISIKLPSSATAIDNYAFSECINLSTVTMGNLVTTIGNYAFDGCSGLSTITLSNTLTTIDQYAFNKCGNLSSISLPSTLTSIGDNAFLRCTSLVAITIPQSVNSIGENAFWGCTKLLAFTVNANNTTYSSTDGVIYNKTKTSIVYCPNGKSGEFSLPSSVTSIGNFAFDGCDNLTAITIPNSVITIGEHAFANCEGLTSLLIPNSVTTIGKDGFYTSSNLTAVSLSNALTTLSYGLFWSCLNLQTITIPASVTSIDDGVFNDCKELTEIRVNSTTPVDLTSSYNVFFGVPKTIPLYVPAGTKAAYAAAEGWKDFTNIIEMGIQLSSNSASFTQAAGSTTTTITSSTAWTAESSDTWLSLSPASGTNNGTLTITATANTGAARTATISVKGANNDIQTITVSQAAGSTSNVALSSADANAIVISPNPTSSYFTVNTSTPATVEVYTQAGALLVSCTATSTDQIMLDAFAAGTYIVKVTTSEGVTEHKLIKQ